MLTYVRGIKVFSEFIKYLLVLKNVQILLFFSILNISLQHIETVRYPMALKIMPVLYKLVDNSKNLQGLQQRINIL